MNRYYTVNEIADELGLSTRTVYRMLEAGLLKGIKTGRVWRVSRNDLNDYLADKSNFEQACSRAHSVAIDTQPVRSFEDMARLIRSGERIDSRRIILEQQFSSGEIERFELPLEVRESANAIIVQITGEPQSSLEISKPGKTRLAIRYFLQSEPAFWAKVKPFFPDNGSIYDWKAAFRLEPLNSRELAALQWAYNLEDDAARPLIEEAVVIDRLTLLEKLGNDHRRAALASLEILFNSSDHESDD